MSGHAADSDGDMAIRSRGQQSPLAARRTKETGGTKQAGTSRFDGMFPLGYKEGFSQWWASIPAAQAEHKVLSYVPFLQQPPTQMVTNSAPPSTSPSAISLERHPEHTSHVTKNSSVDDPYGPRKWHSRLVPLSGRNRALNEFSVERVGETVDHNFVILHGYGAGLGFFYKNFEGLSRARGWQLYALDLLGMGRSSRPPFKLKSKQREQQITEAEDWFVDSLEEWRISKKIDRFTLLGHSMGGYMAVAYALKYPGRLNKLILASPVGIPEDPYAVNAAMPEPGSSTLANEFTQDQDTETTTASNGSIPESVKAPPRTDNNNFLNARSKAEKAAAKDNSGASSDSNTHPLPRKPLNKWFTYLWDANISPFSLVRWSGPLGPRLVSGWTSRRFSHLPPTEAKALHDYAYSLFRLRGSGEYALAYILAPGAFARSPLIRRIHGVGRQHISGVEASSPIAGSPSEPQSSSSTTEIQRRENGIPIVLMYGENDWMDVAGGYAAKEKIDGEKARVLKDASEEERRRDNGDSKVVIVRKAGHHVYLDGWEEFNEILVGEMEDVRKREEQKR
jgi:cardiolipin-specific phospholipase